MSKYIESMEKERESIANKVKCYGLRNVRAGIEAGQLAARGRGVT